MNRKARAKQPRATVLLALRAADVTTSDVTDFVTTLRLAAVGLLPFGLFSLLFPLSRYLIGVVHFLDLQETSPGSKHCN